MQNTFEIYAYERSFKKFIKILITKSMHCFQRFLLQNLSFNSIFLKVFEVSLYMKFWIWLENSKNFAKQTQHNTTYSHRSRLVLETCCKTSQGHRHRLQECIFLASSTSEFPTYFYVDTESQTYRWLAVEHWIFSWSKKSKLMYSKPEWIRDWERFKIWNLSQSMRG